MKPEYMGGAAMTHSRKDATFHVRIIAFVFGQYESSGFESLIDVCRNDL